ncbi:hypothetical protein PAAG_06006 [Paracoccidioides lutzii Pb01]|uniref:Uncharacterized protein n=1 Tax=Paracoccidioides lutzii (strain ATCC MYA-826 / Pb01) TaxID=502779 RepID=C1H5G5_PARBA|nr:hypothetical protein PAAG_06006 [Paracoccidioides lutzii Pb01]EEH34959.2 hypothetical protein PAAG_06006 [Paracoccidioides lutzii Pb01]
MPFADWIPAMIGHAAMCKMLLGCGAGMTDCLAIAAGTAADTHTSSKSSSPFSIASIYIFGSAFAFVFTSLQLIYPGEAMSNDTRGKRKRVSQLTAGTAGIVNAFCDARWTIKIKYWFYVFFAF